MNELARSWRSALADLEVRHPNGRSQVVLRVTDGDPPELYVGLDETTCTLTGETKRDFAISTVRLLYWPGRTLAQQWFACAFIGYLQHEALELVTVRGDRSRKVLDPHAEPYATNPLNRGLRVGFPTELTPTTLEQTLLLVMPYSEMRALVDGPTEPRSDAELHRRQMHPYFKYETIETPRKGYSGRDMKAEGWEPNPHVTGDGRNWQRFDNTDEEYWMRRLS